MPNNHTAVARCTVPLEEVQTLRTIDATKALLERCLEPGAEIVLHCALVTEADISFVQLLYSARTTAERLGGSLRLADVPPVLREVFARSGAIGTAADDPFWTGEAS